MGPSGAGKSTLVDAVRDLLPGPYSSSRVGKMVSGRIYLNNNSAPSDWRLGDVIKYVPQKDIVYEELTPLENVKFNAEWRNPSSDADKQTKSTLSLLEIKKEVWHSKTNTLSGGEKKRVSIAMEIVTNPYAMILDEPTSGLDSTTTCKIMKALRRKSRDGLTSIAIIHQPSTKVFLHFHYFILVGKAGQVIYSGLTSRVEEYFSQKKMGCKRLKSETVQDWVLSIASGDEKCAKEKGKMAGLWRTQANKQSWYTERTRKSNSGREKSNEKTLSCTNEDTQSQMDAEELEELEEKEIGYDSLLLLIISREWSLLLARGIWITVGMTFLVAFGVALVRAYNVEYEKLPGVYFFFSIGLSLVSMMNSLTVFGLDADIRQREFDAGMYIYTYVTGKFVIALLSIAAIPLVFLISYFLFLSGLNKEEKLQLLHCSVFGKMYLLSLLHFLCCYSFGMTISILCSPAFSQLVVVAVIIVLHTFAGFNPPERNFREKTNIICIRNGLQTKVGNVLSGSAKLSVGRYFVEGMLRVSFDDEDNSDEQRKEKVLEGLYGEAGERDWCSCFCSLLNIGLVSWVIPFVLLRRTYSSNLTLYVQILLMILAFYLAAHFNSHLKSFKMLEPAVLFIFSIVSLFLNEIIWFVLPRILVLTMVSKSTEKYFVGAMTMATANFYVKNNYKLS